MSLDISVEGICSRCPNCGGELFITVRQMMDISNGKKEMIQKGVKYGTRLSDVTVITKEKTVKKTIDIRQIVVPVLIALAIFFLKWSRLM